MRFSRTAQIQGQVCLSKGAAFADSHAACWSPSSNFCSFSCSVGPKTVTLLEPCGTKLKREGLCISHDALPIQEVQDGEVMLMDAGCELHGYASDVTRTWPVSGRFTPEQRAVYDIVYQIYRCVWVGWGHSEGLHS